MDPYLGIALFQRFATQCCQLIVSIITSSSFLRAQGEQKDLNGPFYVLFGFLSLNNSLLQLFFLARSVDRCQLVDIYLTFTATNYISFRIFQVIEEVTPIHSSSMKYRVMNVLLLFFVIQII
jgi:hypothetical protein